MNIELDRRVQPPEQVAPRGRRRPCGCLEQGPKLFRRGNGTRSCGRPRIAHTAANFSLPPPATGTGGGADQSESVTARAATATVAATGAFAVLRLVHLEGAAVEVGAIQRLHGP